MKMSFQPMDFLIPQLALLANSGTGADCRKMLCLPSGEKLNHESIDFFHCYRTLFFRLISGMLNIDRLYLRVWEKIL